MTQGLPRRVTVAEVLESRYEPGERPISWDHRSAGTEKILTDSGETVVLASAGGQSSPAVGWELLLMSEAAQGDAYAWTLYGVAKSES